MSESKIEAILAPAVAADQRLDHARRHLLVAGGVALLSTSIWARAASYPERPIRLVLGFPPGGATDNSARLVAMKMAEFLGQSIVIDNRPGASGIIAAEHVALSPPDGYTLFYTTSTIHGINPSVHARLPYDPIADFVPVAYMSKTPLFLLVGNQLGVNSVNDLIELAKSRAGELNYASAGLGSTQHLAGALFCRQAGIDAVHVPYKGSAPALTELMSGQVHFMIDTVSASIGYVQGQKLRALAISSLEPSPFFPDVPTIHSAGVPDYQVAAWGGFMVPKGTPPAVVQRLNDAANAAARDPEIIQRTRETGSELQGGTPERFGAWIQEELARWKIAVATAGVEAQ